MFTTEDFHATQRGLNHHRTTKDGKEIPLVTFALEFMGTPKLAKELSDYVRRTLYTSSEAIAPAQLRACSFDLSVPTQRIRVRMAPDQAEDSYSLTECKIGIVTVRRYKEAGWKLTFPVTCSPASPSQLMQIAESKDKGRWFTFAEVKPDLFSTLKDKN